MKKRYGDLHQDRKPKRVTYPNQTSMNVNNLFICPSLKVEFPKLARTVIPETKITEGFYVEGPLMSRTFDANLLSFSQSCVGGVLSCRVPSFRILFATSK